MCITVHLIWSPSLVTYWYLSSSWNAFFSSSSFPTAVLPLSILLCGWFCLVNVCKLWYISCLSNWIISLFCFGMLSYGASDGFPSQHGITNDAQVCLLAVLFYLTLHHFPVNAISLFLRGECLFGGGGFGVYVHNYTHRILIHAMFLLSRLHWIIWFRGQTLTLPEF